MENYVITIARGFGSGGKTIGVRLAQKLGIPCYDQEILQMAADESGISEEYFAGADEKAPFALFAGLKNISVEGAPHPEDREFTSNENLFYFQAKVIRSLALTQSFVIIGRASNFLLRAYPNAVHINIQAPRNACIEEVKSRMSVSEKEADRLISKTDRYRTNYYHFYTGETWNHPACYDLSINSHSLGWDNCVRVITDFAAFKVGHSLRPAEKD